MAGFIVAAVFSLPFTAPILAGLTIAWHFIAGIGVAGAAIGCKVLAGLSIVSLFSGACSLVSNACRWLSSLFCGCHNQSSAGEIEYNDSTINFDTTPMPTVTQTSTTAKVNKAFNSLNDQSTIYLNSDTNENAQYVRQNNSLKVDSYDLSTSYKDKEIKISTKEQSNTEAILYSNNMSNDI